MTGRHRLDDQPGRADHGADDQWAADLAAMRTPRRIQLRLTPGTVTPSGVVHVGRGPWRNPWRAPADYTAVQAVDRFRAYLDARRDPPRGWRDVVRYPSDDEIRAALRGRDLACWCDPDLPCHADVLIEVANQAAPASSPPTAIACSHEQILGDECAQCGGYLGDTPVPGRVGTVCSTACHDAQGETLAAQDRDEHLRLRDLHCTCRICVRAGAAADCLCAHPAHSGRCPRPACGCRAYRDVDRAEREREVRLERELDATDRGTEDQ